MISRPRPLATPGRERRRRHDRRGKPAPGQALVLEQAIESSAIEVLFQPLFQCGAEAPAGAEALVRWHHPRQGLLAGDRVFALARDVGLADRLARYVCRSAMTVATGWPDHLRLSLNATAGDLADPGYPALILECLAQTGFPARRLTLEITEQALVEGIEGAVRMLGGLTDRGIAIALDDFGAGFCNFGYLKALPLAALKLDRTMVVGITTDRRDLAVFRAIMAMARALDLRVIAEGIETRAQQQAVCREGCDLWQGFLGAPPLPSAEFAALVA